MDVEGLRAELAENGQEHLLQHWNSLTEQEQQILYDDLKSIDYPKLNIYFQVSPSFLNGTVHYKEPGLKSFEIKGGHSCDCGFLLSRYCLNVQKAM